MGAGKKLSLAAHVQNQQQKAQQRGGRSWEGRLNWRGKDNQKPSRSGVVSARVYVLLATKAPMVEMPVHSFPKIVETKKGDKRLVKVFNVDMNCFEDNAVVEQQNRYDDAGRRMAPPILCPLCRFNAWIRNEIENERLSWTDRAFEFVGDTEKIVLHAGGMIGMFGGWDLTEEDKGTLKDAGINIREAFKENTNAKIKFLYCVVDLENLDKGLQVALETSSVGQGQSALIDERVSELGSKGDPTENPTPFKWAFFPKNKPAEMYSVSSSPWEETPVPEGSRVKAIEIARSPKVPAVFENMRRYPNVKFLRLAMEAACLIDDVPWDDIFAPIWPRLDEKGYFVDADDKTADEEATSVPPGESSSDEAGKSDTFECGGCGKDVPNDAKACPYCGAEFDDEEDDEGSAAEALDAASKAPDEPKPVEPPKEPEKLQEVADAKATTRRGGAKKPSDKAKRGAKSDVKDLPKVTPEEAATAALGDDDLPWED